MRFCGVDEAGKGAVLGPMVIAAVGCERPDDFADLGVRDSKELTPRKREMLFFEIDGRFPTAIRIIEAADIDLMRRLMTMNAIVARFHAEVISDLGPETAYVDACDVNAWRYGRTVESRLERPCVDNLRASRRRELSRRLCSEHRRKGDERP